MSTLAIQFYIEALQRREPKGWAIRTALRLDSLSRRKVA